MRVITDVRLPVLARFAVTMAAAAVVAACSSAASSSAPASNASSAAAGSNSTASANQAAVSNVTLRIGDQAGTGAKSLLTAAGLIDKLPFKVEWSNFTSGPPMLEAMGSGSVDVGGVGDAPPVFAASGGSQITIVAALKASPQASALLVPKGSPIHSVADLKGKKIAVAQGSSADYHLLTVLNKAGISVKDVTLVYLQPAAGLAALTSGHVDAWDIWSPFLEEAQAQDNATAVVTGQGYGSPYSFEVASKAALTDPAKAAAIKDLISLLTQAHAWANAHVSSWASIWADATGLPLAIMQKASADDVTSVVPLTAAVVQAEQQVADAFSTAGLIPSHLTISNFVATQFETGASS